MDMVLMVLLFFTTVSWGLDYDPNDFAIEMIEYVQGSGVGTDWLTGDPFNDPYTALGRPTLETTGDGWSMPPSEDVPVVPVYAPFRAFELVTIGNGGHLTVKFSHPVANDKNNPYGIDFIIFGNASQSTAGGLDWANGNPENFGVAGGVANEPGIVSVSQDGGIWYEFTSGPYADDFAPTASYKWDRDNDVWSDELDPTRPIDPCISAADFAGQSLADMIDAYDGSAGGVGFDLEDVGLDWILYVRISDDPGSSATTEIDAIADVSGCGDYKHPFPVGDLTEDCNVNLMDFALLCEHWLECTWQCP